MSILPSDFALAVSISDLLGPEEVGSQGNPELLRAFDALGLKVDLKQLCQRFFAADVGKGDVLQYRHAGTGGNFFAIDLYRGMSDQLDIVELVFRVGQHADVARSALHAFFESSRYQVHYEEGCALEAVSALLGKEAFPRIVELYAQECFLMQDD